MSGIWGDPRTDNQVAESAAVKHDAGRAVVPNGVFRMSLSRRSRVGIYYLVLKGQLEEAIFVDDAGCRRFIDLLASVLADTDYRLYALCLLPDEIHLAVTMSQIPLADFTQRLVFKSNQKARQRYGRTGLLAAPAEEARLFDKEE